MGTDASSRVTIPSSSPIPTIWGSWTRIRLAPGASRTICNGAELGSGSLRIHEPGLQRRVLRILGLEDEEIDRKFGFLLEALSAGAPPHGGIALGIARTVRELSGAPSLRDVIAFPKTTAARALYEGAPTAVTDEELRELHLRLAE